MMQYGHSATLKRPLRIALMISGSGTTAAAIINACTSGALDAIPVCVISSRKNAEGINVVRSLGVSEDQVYVFPRKEFATEGEFGQAILSACVRHDVAFVGQYGWLPLTPMNVVTIFENSIVNQHPAPLDPGYPDFGGEGMYGRRAVYARMLFARHVGRDFWTEATAHRVAAAYDQGKILRAIRVPFTPDDTVESLYERLKPIEHEVQIQTIRDFTDNDVHEINRQERLVRPDERHILETCKAEAIKAYPHG